MAIHSRAFLLLRRDLVNLQRFPLTGISASPTDSYDLFNWTAKVEGLSGTIWEGGVFQVKLTFTDDFNCVPPAIHFITVPFHPNIDPSNGIPSIHLLSENGWHCINGFTEDITVASILLRLQALLSNPELDDGCVLNPSAAHLLREAPHTYKQMVLDCVTASLRIDAGLTPFEPDTPPQSPHHTVNENETSVSRQGKPMKPVSYDDYHILWKGIATSITDYKRTNQFTRLLNTDIELGHVHHEQIRTLETKLEQHSEMKYGKPPSNKKAIQRCTVGNAKSRLKRVEELRSLYKNATDAEKGDASCVPVVLQKRPVSVLADNSEEVEQLVQWTKDLNELQLVS